MDEQVADRGSVTVWMVLVVAVCLLAGTAAVRLGTDAASVGRAQAVADLAALAAVDGGAGAAARVASANGASLRSCDCVGLPRRVVVALGGSTARASADRLVDRGPEPGGP